jgi:hypothetical protein
MPLMTLTTMICADQFRFDRRGADTRPTLVHRQRQQRNWIQFLEKKKQVLDNPFRRASLSSILREERQTWSRSAKL